jgi:hypothetical protein
VKKIFNYAGGRVRGAVAFARVVAAVRRDRIDLHLEVHQLLSQNLGIRQRRRDHELAPLESHHDAVHPIELRHVDAAIAAVDGVAPGDRHPDRDEPGHGLRSM